MNSHFELPDRDLNYIADYDLLKEIKNELTKSKKCYVFGVPGVGKSSIAIELAYDLNETHWAIWFDCASEAKVNESTQRLAKRLDIAFKDLRSTVRKIKNKLTASDKKILIILDNVEQYDHVKFISESLSQNLGILITTRDERLNLDIKNFLVDYFNRQKAKTYIKGNIRERALSDENITKVIELIKSKNDAVLPLDLKCVVAFLNENTKLPIDDYCQELTTVDYMQAILNRFQENDKDAWQLLAYIAYMDGDFIDLSLLIDIFKNKMENRELQKAINTLKRLSLVDELIKEDKNGIKEHRLIQEKTQTFFKQRKVNMKEHLVKIFDTLSPIMSNINKDNSKWAECKLAYNHANKFIDYTEIIEITKVY